MQQYLKGLQPQLTVFFIVSLSLGYILNYHEVVWFITCQIRLKRNIVH